MPKFPEPPDSSTLRSIEPHLQLLAARTVLWRIYFHAGDHPTTWDAFRAWGPTAARLDHQLPPPQLQERRILYGAIGPRAALTTLAEVFQATRIIERARRAPALVALEVTRNVQLLDLTGRWPTRAGASLALCSGQRPRARRWSRAIYDAYPAVEGLLYGSSMNGSEPCVALYERAATAMPARPVFHRQLADPALLTVLKNACAELGYRLV